MSASAVGLLADVDPLTGRVGGELQPVEAWEADPAAQDAAYAAIRRSWEVPHVSASSRILAAMAEEAAARASGTGDEPDA